MATTKAKAEKFKGLEATGVHAVSQPATRRQFLVVGDEDVIAETVETDGIDRAEQSPEEVITGLQELAAEAPKEVQQAVALIAEWIAGNQKPADEAPEEGYGYPAPQMAASTTATTITPINMNITQGTPNAVEPIMAASYPVRGVTADWFDNPGFSGPTPLTVTDEGRVFGHIARWGTCHTGFSSQCVMPPKSGSNYAFFRTGVVRADGKDIPVGQITVNTGHPDLKLDARTAAAHYDNTGTAVADVACGEDEFGVWVAGSVRPTATLEQVHVLRASSPSGDWRSVAGNLELIGILAVNVPGFPVPRTLAASAFEVDDDGVVKSVIAMGNQGLDPATAEYIETLTARIERLEGTLNTMRPHFADIIRAKAGVPHPKKKVPGEDKAEEVMDEENEDYESKKKPVNREEEVVTA